MDAAGTLDRCREVARILREGTGASSEIREHLAQDALVEAIAVMESNGAPVQADS